jgi:hypothetical protein
MINANPVKTNPTDLDWYEQKLLMLNHYNFLVIKK